MNREIVGYWLSVETIDGKIIKETNPIYKSNVKPKKGDVIRPRIFINGKQMCDLIIQD